MDNPKISDRQRSYALFLLVVVFTFSHIDRQIIAVLQIPIKAAFQISDTQLGLLTGVAFAAFYATFGMPMAMWADRHNRRNLIAFSIALWSGMTALCGLATQYWQLLLARIGVGVGEAGSNPPSHSIISDMYPPHQRATAMAIFSMGVNFGVMGGYLIGGWINEWFGWRWAFVIAGVPGLAVALLVRFTMIEPIRGYADRLVNTEPAPPFRLVVKTMLQSASVRHLLIATALLAMAGYAAVAWVPVYFHRLHGYSTSELGTFLALAIGLGGGIGTFLGGFFADRLAVFSEGWRAWLSCTTFVVTGPTAYLSYTTTDAFLAAVFFTGPAMLAGVHIGTNYAILQAQVPVEMRSVAAAIGLFTLNIVGLGLGPLSVGIISDWLAPSIGVDSLRYGLLFTLLISAWGLVHQGRLGFLLHKSRARTPPD